MKRKRNIKCAIIFVILIIAFINISYAFTPEDLKGTDVSTVETDNFINDIVKITSTVGSIFAVIVIGILGIKYMMGSVQEKAEYKKTFMPYLIGAIFVFAATTITTIIYNVADKLSF